MSATRRPRVRIPVSPFYKFTVFLGFSADTEKPFSLGILRDYSAMRRDSHIPQMCVVPKSPGPFWPPGPDDGKRQFSECRYLVAMSQEIRARETADFPMCFGVFQHEESERFQLSPQWRACGVVLSIDYRNASLSVQGSTSVCGCGASLHPRLVGAGK